MKSRSALNGFGLPLALLFSKRARRAVQGLVTLRRTYEYVLVMAALESGRGVGRPYYEGYVDALEVLGAKALLVARNL